ncbi:hypothetical protein [Ligilactobacillus aviarius]|uniref:hypothetical protein n=1 Tax=Ligilactobacillus aviarius TaxID=1606 RepID=UPI00388F335A
MTKRKKRAWWKQKSERIAEHRFGTFRTSLASRRSSFVLEPDYVDIARRLRLMSQSLFFAKNAKNAKSKFYAKNAKFAKNAKSK